MEDINIVIDTEHMAEYFFSALTSRGYAITKMESEEISDAAFDYLIELGLIDEKLVDEEDD